MIYLPLLCITSNVEAYIEINGIPVGECSEKKRLPYAALEGDTFYISAYPLSRHVMPYMPIVRKLILSGARPAMPFPDGVRLCCWDNGTIDLHISLPRLVYERSGQPFSISVLDSIWPDTHITLYNDCGIKLLIEKSSGDTTVFSLGVGVGGNLQKLDVGDDILAVIRAELSDRERLLVMRRDKSVMLDIHGTSVGIEEGRPYSLEVLPTLRRHQRKIVYEYTGGDFNPISQDRGFFTGTEIVPTGKHDKAIALCEAAREGFFEEAKSYLTLDMRSDDVISVVRSLCGDFEYASVPIGLEDRTVIGLCRKTESGIYESKLLCFEFDNGSIYNIEEL